MTKRILVVDDDHAMVSTICDILGLYGWETSQGHDGDVATNLVMRESMDLVLMDVIMPRMNGVEALRAIKARRPSTRVILMTAFAGEDLLAEAEKEGAYRILRKPVQLPNLLSLLEEAVH